jgi:hypothetical protein
VKEHRFVDEIYDDLDTTMEWLDEKREGLGDEFETEFFATVNAAKSRPESYSINQTGYRTIPLKRFSAVTYFSIEQDIVVIVGVLMGGRSESNLRGRGITKR